MTNEKKLEWVLRIGVFGEFLGHGIFALQGKASWIAWTQQFTGFSLEAATTFITIVGIMDVIMAIVVLVKPMKPLLLWMAFWGFWTALLRPLVGEPIWDFVERWANAAAPLALYFLYKGQNK
jgi:uncharacterized membrane protein YphA (DoxX/SURF4 family)